VTRYELERDERGERALRGVCGGIPVAEIEVPPTADQAERHVADGPSLIRERAKSGREGPRRVSQAAPPRPTQEAGSPVEPGRRGGVIAGLARPRP
jgi:hypothetical protein